MVTEVSSGIKISVSTQYEQQYSNPSRGTHFFVYYIDIENLNAFPVKLLSRHWIIFDAQDAMREVVGQGVVGKQPIIEPNSHFRYNSGCDFKSAIGKMKGTYTMQNEVTGECFTVQIPEFTTEVPFILN
ncbi:MAG TPA: Co2+/Mg2+ efflux protein ApaG [Luteibaculaceae bacterium]|nr:Co2+/Mg2+ efflux protein ApaG [Luteibaculaceae bacterium]